jgi:hypothetical protein
MHQEVSQLDRIENAGIQKGDEPRRAKFLIERRQLLKCLKPLGSVIGLLGEHVLEREMTTMRAGNMPFSIMPTR